MKFSTPKGGQPSVPASSLNPSTVVTVASPSAGADWSYTFTGGPATILGFSGRLVTSAAVATRGVTLELTGPSGNPLWLLPAPASQAAALTEYYQAYPGNPWALASQAGLPASVQMFPFPELTVGNGWTLSATTTNIQGGDLWQVVRILVVTGS